MRQKGFSEILILIAVLILLAGGYFLLKSPPKFSSPLPSLSPQQTLPETQNWNTYNGQNHQLEFQYPNNWYISDNTLPSSPIILNDGPVQTGASDAPKGKVYISNHFCPYGENQIRPCGETIAEYVSAISEDLEEKSKNIEQISVGRENATQVSGILMEGTPYGGMFVKNTILQLPGSEYPLVFSLFGQDAEKTYDLIISTVKFNEDGPEGRFCGGIAANLPENQCPKGYQCNLAGDYPDAGGKCVKE